MLHRAKLCFSVVLKHFRGNSQRTSFFNQNMAISERSTEILRKFVFLNKFENGQILWKILFGYTNFFDQTSIMGEILTNTCFSPQSEPHRAKLCFSVVLKHFRGNSQRTSLFNQNMAISEMSTALLRKFVFLKYCTIFPENCTFFLDQS